MSNDDGPEYYGNPSESPPARGISPRKPGSPRVPPGYTGMGNGTSPVDGGGRKVLKTRTGSGSGGGGREEK